MFTMLLACAWVYSSDVGADVAQCFTSSEMTVDECFNMARLMSEGEGVDYASCTYLNVEYAREAYFEKGKLTGDNEEGN